MKRWEPIKTEKKQLGGIIKLLQKVSPKLASKAKGRLLAAHLGQIKDLKTPYIFPGQLGWSPAETRTVWHRTNNPNFKIKRVFEGRWDAKEHGKVKRYIISSRNPTKVKDPFIQHDMEQIHFYNSNTNPDMLIGHDLKTNDVIPSKGTEYVIWDPKQIINNG